MRKSLIAAAIALMAASPAAAAEFNVVPGYKTAIRMDGDIEYGDAAKLQNVLNYRVSLGISTDYIMLNSPGGYIMAAGAVADIIRNNHIHTVIDGGGYCVSACVLEFAAGYTRNYWPGARIGVHSATNDQGAVTGTSLQATMAMARVFSMLGVPAVIIGKMVSAPGSDIAWLDANDVSGWANEAH